MQKYHTKGFSNSDPIWGCTNRLACCRRSSGAKSDSTSQEASIALKGGSGLLLFERERKHQTPTALLQIRPRLPGIPALLKLRLSFLKSRHAIRASSRRCDWPSEHHLAFRSCSNSVLYCQWLRHVAQAVDECLDYRVYHSALQSDDSNWPETDRKIDRQ
jgi:hypothetical protein